MFNPSDKYPDTRTIWRKFEPCFINDIAKSIKMLICDILLWSVSILNVGKDVSASYRQVKKHGDNRFLSRCM